MGDSKNWAAEVKRKMKSKGTEGSFRRYCIGKGFDKVTTACINVGLKSKDPGIRKKAGLAKTFASMRRKK